MTKIIPKRAIKKGYDGKCAIDQKEENGRVK